MKKVIKVIGIILGAVIILGMIFFIVDNNRVKNNERPIFCITVGTMLDGGTVEFFGLGYKVIDFHTIAGFDDIKIGTWFMDYNDFDEEMKVYEIKFEEELRKNEEYTRKPNNVTIEILSDTVTNQSLEIAITDNNIEQYGWGVEFRIQEKVNGEWKNLKYISDELSWIDIAYELGENKQLIQKLDIEEYYGKLSNGIYRIVKPVYDGKYIDIYSNEFEIK